MYNSNYSGTMVDALLAKVDKSHTITVAKSGGDFTTIKAAIASITDNDIDNRYTIQVYPGIYTEANPVTLKDYVNIEGIGGQTVTKVIANNSANNIFISAKFAVVKDFELEGAFTAAAIYANAAGSTYHQDVTIINCQYGLRVNHIDAEIGLYNFNALTYGGHIIDDIIRIEAGSADVRNLYTIEQSVVTNLIRTTSNNSSLKCWNIESESANVTYGLHASGGSKITCIASDLNYCKYGVKVDGAGSKVITRDTMIYESDAYDIWLANGGEFKGYSCCLNRDKIYDEHSDGIFHAYGWDYTENIFRSLADFSVGLPFQGRSCYLGKGGPYYDSVKVLSYNGSVYSDVTDSGTIQFPNVNVDTCLYFGDLNGYSWQGLNYIMGNQKLTGGSCEWQYYDSATGWTKINTLNTIDGQSNSYNGDSFIGENGILLSARFDTNICDGITESSSGAMGWTNYSVSGQAGKWVRFIITSQITQSPIFSTINLKGSYTRVRENGTRSYNGEARSIRLTPLIFGDNSGGAVSASRNVSTNITYPYWNNALRDAQNDKIYFRFVIPDWVDTASGITFKCELSTNKAGGGSTYTAKLHFYSSCMPCEGTFDGNNPETIQDFDFVVGTTDLANKSQCITMTDRIDITGLSYNDRVYMCIHREGAHGNDDLTATLVMSNVTLEAYVWQDGRCCI